MAETACPTCRTPLPPEALYCLNCGSRTGAGDSRAAVAPPDLGERLARALGPKYQVRRMLGEGGFAQVFEVFDTDLQRRLAVKVLKPDIAWSAGMLERFREECRAIARLSHPNILAIHFVGEGEGLVYYAMPFVEGEPLSVRLRRSGAMDADQALAIMRPLLDALAHAHAQGLIHRDIKPDNIMLEASTGRPLLVDFGIAKRLDGGGHQTQTGFVVGTPQYMSPEQALGSPPLDARTDIYSVGAVLYQMVTGAPPFEGASSQEIVGKHLTEPPPLASRRNALIPMWLSEVIAKCLAKDREQRFSSANTLMDALGTGRVSGAQQPVSAERVARKLASEESTVKLPSAQRTRPLAPQADPPARRTGRHWPVIVAAVLGLAAWLWLGRSPVLVVQNRLIAPIRIAVGSDNFEVPAGGQIEHRLRRRAPPVALWFLVRPTGSDGVPLGLELQGKLDAPRRKGRASWVVDASSADQPVFAPLVTNATNGPLAVTVNAGTQKAMPCGCQVPPGSTRYPIGYYPLYQNSSVQAATSTGATATFRDLGSQVDQREGTVGLRFEPKDFPP
jgi:serine/threonine-protein kinase